MSRAIPERNDWLAKTLAGVLAGLVIALEASALFAALPHGLPPPLMAQLTMWLVMPIWLSVLAGCFAFRNGVRAWLWLGGAAVVLVAAHVLLLLIP